ncbi:MAG: EAL domain-containing protein [Angelakisella sp.]
MKKISGKIFAVTICCSCLAILLLGNISLWSSSAFLRKTSEEMLVWMARDYASAFSNELVVIEDRVKELEIYVRDTIDVAALKSDPDYLATYEEQLSEYIYNFAMKRTSGVSAWCYFNPELSDTPHDVYFADEDGDGIPERQNHIPLEYYDSTPLPTDDKQWWYGPVQTGEGFWTNPYQWTLKNGEVIEVVSYAQPIYIEGKLIAVVGTYYHFGKMYNEIRSIKVCENGYASLFNEKLDVIVHPTLHVGTRFTSDNLETIGDGHYKDMSSRIKDTPYGIVSFYTQDAEHRLLAYSKLTNGWILGLSPPLSEIYVDIYSLFIKLLMAVIACMLLSIVAAWYMGRFISRPLMAVAEGAKRIGTGDLSVPITVSTKDEIRMVAQSLNEMMENTTHLQKELTKLAYCDELTKGNNLNKFKLLAAEQLLKHGDKQHYLVRLDIKDFKLINDMFGFDDGDIVLCNIAKAISSILVRDECFARISNDDFIALLQRDNDDQLIWLGNAFRSRFEALHRESGCSYTISFAYGAYKIPPNETDIVTIIDRCTMAHKTAKLHPDGVSYAFYNEQIRDSALRVKFIEDNMQSALQHGEFVVYLQPKFDLFTRDITGAEALVRWISPTDHRVIPPGEFIPIFERNGFVANIDLFVLEEVCKLQRAWMDEGLSPVPISVNQSKVLLFDCEYIEKVCAIVDRYAVPHEIIELEILETLIHHNISALQSTILELKKLRFLVSIDDFGSGYSSLNMLKDIHADVLKIDKEFLNSSEDNARSEVVLSHIIRMARDLNMSVVTEGVETEKQAEMLRSLNCDTAQGYLFARPMPVADYYKLIHMK